MTHKVAFFSVVFPGVEKYLDDFFSSLKDQTYKDFDLVLVNDKLENFGKFTERYQHLNIIEIKSQDTPVKNREKGFQFLAGQKYEDIILGDADDYYGLDRIEKCLSWLTKYDIVVNDFDLVNTDSCLIKEKYISQRLPHRYEVGFDFLKNKNIFGFGNSAIKGSALKSCRFGDDLIAVDWFLFSCLLKEGFSAVFVNDTKTYHRLYDYNTLSLDQITPFTFQNGLDIKIRHFAKMISVDDSFNILKQQLEQLRQELQEADGWCQYIELVKKEVNRPPLWLEEIQWIRRYNVG